MLLRFFIPSAIVRFFAKRILGQPTYLGLGAFACAIVILLAACSPTTGIFNFSGVNSPAQIRIGYQVIPNAELMLKAMKTVEKTFPRSEVKWQRFDSGRDINTAMASQEIDLGLLGSTDAAIGIANQIPYQIYFLHNPVGNNEALVAKSYIKALPDLKGRKIAVPFGSTSHFSLLSALEELGLQSDEVSLLNKQPSGIIAAWQQEEIDAAYVWQPILTKLVSAKGRVLLSTKDLYQRGISTADVSVVQRDFIAQYPAVVKTYVRLLDQARKFYQEQPRQAVAAIAPELDLSSQQSAQVMKELVWLTPAEQSTGKYLGTRKQPGNFAQALKDSATFMKKRGALPNVPDLAVFQAGIYSDGVAK
jgi:taurine transport system substrate-binding protein